MCSNTKTYQINHKPHTTKWINRKSRKELRFECGRDSRQHECLNLFGRYEWFACEYRKDSHNCVAVLGAVDPENTITPPPNKEQGFCYLNSIKILF